MAGLLILLYALHGITEAVPAGCFIAAWILLGVRIALELGVRICKKIAGKKDGRD